MYRLISNSDTHLGGLRRLAKSAPPNTIRLFQALKPSDARRLRRFDGENDGRLHADRERTNNPPRAGVNDHDVLAAGFEFLH